MPRILSWNIYHGAINGQTPMQRLATIATLCQQNNIDIICLQEVPTATLTPGVPFGMVGAGAQVTAALQPIPNFLANYTVLQALSENNPQGPQATITSDGYLIIFRTATFAGGWGGMNYYQPAQFFNQIGNFLRPPITLNLQNNAGNILTVMNWHAETGPGAGVSLQQLNLLVGPANNQANPCVIAGDFNVRGNFAGTFGGQQNFAGWVNIVATYPGAGNLTIQGLDHILTSQNCNIILGNALNFISDAYHYPIAGSF